METILKILTAVVVGYSISYATVYLADKFYKNWDE